MEKEGKINFVSVLLLFVIGVFLTTQVLASNNNPSWNVPNGVNISLEEDQSPEFTYNFSANITEPDGETMTFFLGDTISSNLYGNQSTSFFYWVSLNGTTGVLTINSTMDNQTGEHNITIYARDEFPPILQSESRFFKFIINATNDAPVFTDIQNNYTLTQGVEFYDTISATDEEKQYPLVFNITWLDSCTHTESGIPRTNCTLFTPLNISNTTISMNYTPSGSDVGVYPANISVMDAGNTTSCPYTYCEENYSRNITTYYSTIINFTVQGILEVNITDCQNRVFQENQSNTCKINITTKGQTDSLNITSFGIIRNYTTSVSNSSWFFGDNLTNTVNFFKSIDINVTPQKTEIGNWTINLTTNDITTGETNTTQIYIYVNRTYNDPPKLTYLPDVNTSTYKPTTINITVYDDDLLIPDKLDGYNETINITRQILNRSNLTQNLPLTNFTINITSMPVSGTNRTEANIYFTANSTEYGNYTINITARDKDGINVNQMFNLTIFLNNFPKWNSSLPNPEVIVLNEDTTKYFNFSQNVFDPDGDTLSFNFTNDSRFDSFKNSFNLTTGVLNFSISPPADVDVGYHNVTITVSDGFLTATHEFNFTINNTNDNPSIQSYGPMNNNASVNAGTHATTLQEDNTTALSFLVPDEDFGIIQTSFYDETITLNLTIEGPNKNLFTFTNVLETYTQARFETGIFTPNKTDVGNYNITINVTDASNVSTWIEFNLTVLETQHAPSLIGLSNLNFTINDSIYLDINTTDREDGNDSSGINTNFTFVLTNLTTGGDFLKINSTSGIINFTFNQTYAGRWQYNLSVNDSSGLTTSQLFNVTVWDYPKILLPQSSTQFNFFENNSFSLNFTANQTVDSLLNYTLIINNITRNSTMGYGNATAFIWNFTANFTDETTCSGPTQLALNVSNEKLSAYASWNLTINHTNYPLSFDTDIPNASNGTSHRIDLSKYFTDIDATDNCTNQTISFSINSTNSSGTAQTVSLSDWENTNTPTATFSATGEGTHISNHNITAKEKNSSGSVISTVNSNNFTITLFVNSTQHITKTVTTPSRGGSGSNTETKIASLNLIIPEPISSKKKDILIIPLGVENDGEVTLKNIVLSSIIAKAGLIRTDLVASFDKSFIDELAPGQRENVTLIVDVDTTQTGIFEVTINGTVEDPSFSDFTKFFIEIREDENVKEKIIFTEEFLIGNPRCAEFKDLVDEARKQADLENLDEARNLLDQAISACTKAIEEPFTSRVLTRISDTLFNYVGLISLISFGVGFAYYFYQRIKLKRALRGY